MTPEQEADIARLSALRDSGQISGDDFERLSAAIRGDAEPSSWPPNPTQPGPSPVPLGREKPVREVDPHRSGAFQPVAESGREPRAAFEPAPDGGAADAAAPVAPEPASQAAAAVEPGALQAGPPQEAPHAAIAAAGAGNPPLPPPVSATSPGPFERYPMRYEVLYPDHLSRWKTLIRLFLLIPLVLFYYPFSAAMEGLAVIGWTAVFWRKKYPSWAFRGITGMLEYQARVTAYALLQTDKFPSFDRDQSLVRLDFAEPAPGTLSRWRVFWWKLFFVIPHLVVLGFLQLALSVVTVLAWFGILFTGNYPRGMFGFASGVTRWQLRVAAYFLSLNDRFPAYSLSDEAGAGSRGASVASGIAGVAAVAGIAAIIVVAVVITGKTHNEDVSYAALQSGTATTTRLSGASGDTLIQLQKATDPGDNLIQVIHPAAGEKVIVFQWRVSNGTSVDAVMSSDLAHLSALTTQDGVSRERGYSPVFTVAGDRAVPVSVASGGTVVIQAVFVVPEDARPTKLQFHNGFAGRGGITYRFH
jgi:Domain of unknown function (DUF4389)